MPYTGSPPTFSTGEKTGIAAKLNQLRDAIRGFTDPWTSYTPTLTATTTNPTGWTQTGYYMRTGKLIACRFSIVAGASMTAGSGYYQVALPAAAASSYPGATAIGLVIMSDASSGNIGQAWAQLNAGPSLVRLNYAAAYPVGGWTATNPAGPWAWAANDSIVGQLMYEAA